MTEPVLLEDLTDGVLRLTLNRPDRLNAFTPDLHASLRAAIAHHMTCYLKRLQRIEIINVQGRTLLRC